MIINVISISQNKSNKMSEEEIDFELLKYPKHFRPTLKRLALEGEVISEVYKEIYDFNYLT